MPVTSWSTSPSSNNAAPPNGWPEGMAAAAVNDTARQMMADLVVEFQRNPVKVLGTVAGTNTITAVMTPTLTAYSAGMTVVFTPAISNTGATTLNINGLGALDVQKDSGAALVSGDLVAGIPAFLVLDSGADDWNLLNPQTTILSLANTFTDRQTLTSTVTGNNASLQISSSTPGWQVNETDAAANNRLWQFYAAGERLSFDATTDAGAGTTWLSVDRTGSTVDSINLQATSVQINGSQITWGTYTPTASTFTNLDSATPAVCQYMRVGAVVTVSGMVTVNATASANTQFEITLPVASNLAASNQLAGTGAVFGGASASDTVRIQGQSTNDRALLNWHATSTGAVDLYFSFTYLII